jgi:ABC-type transport system involved in cytochrome c biogenesis permease subunit
MKDFFLILFGVIILVGMVTLLVHLAEAPTSCDAEVTTAVQAEKDWWLDTHNGIMEAMEKGDTLMVSGGEDLMTRRMYGD